MKSVRTIKGTAGVVVLVISLLLGAHAQKSSDTVSIENVVDLTHTLDENFPYIPIPGITFPFKKTPIATIDKLGVAAYRWDFHEHIGTQIDAPSHFFADGLSLEQMPVRDLIAPLAVIDISSRARTNADTALTIDDIKNWEKKYGRLPKGAAVFMYSGWDAKVGDAKAFINMDGSNTMHFPGFSPEAAEFLVKERDVVGIGVDVMSLDPGNDKEYKAHKAWLKAGKWGVECVANLKNVPPVGATVFVGATKVGGATGGPVRLIAVFASDKKMNAGNSSELATRMVGRWKSAAAEKVGNLGYRTREFNFRKDRWWIEVVFYSDEKLTDALFSFVGEGPYELGAESKTAAGATEAVFHFDKKILKVLADESKVSGFGFSGCDLNKGVAKDVSTIGCGNFTSVAVCGQEYDLVKLDGNTLYLGSRPADGNMCTADKRPKALGQPLAKQK
ncbi:MAG: cyclase family protein [Pyrinomonadaceae bacterium]